MESTPMVELMVAALDNGPGSGATLGMTGVGIGTLLTAVVAFVVPAPLTLATSATVTMAAPNPRTMSDLMVLAAWSLLIISPFRRDNGA
jgi:hypothetical protein